MAQFTPQVSDADVERIINRDIAPEHRGEVHEIVRRLEVRDKARVALACLKNARGDINRLKTQLAEARGYYREIVGEAEFPNYVKHVFRFDQLTEREKDAIFEKDKQQYLAWLSA
jgi:hypothetical protein